jgi:S1-C subfamily serine protease
VLVCIRFTLLIGLALATPWPAAAKQPLHTERGPDSSSLVDVVLDVQPKIVKLYGAGGVRGLEAYQTGVLISPEGELLTVWSHVLDTDYITATLHDGRKFEARLVGAQRVLELALLKIDAQDLPHFRLEEPTPAEPGARVLAFSNLFSVAAGEEPVSVQHGLLSARTTLDGRRGAFETAYRGPIYVVDAMTNNPGAAGGALTDQHGRLLGLIGKELRNARDNTWLNYAAPLEVLVPAVLEIRSGKSTVGPLGEETPTERPREAWSLDHLGLVLVPDAIVRTPPFVDAVRTGSPAATAGIAPDDLILLINGRLVPSCKAVRAELEQLDRADGLTLSINRDDDLIELQITPPSP